MKGFIEIHDMLGIGSLVNVLAIESVSKYSVHSNAIKSCIKMSDGEMYVRESYEEIKNLITKAI